MRLIVSSCYLFVLLLLGCAVSNPQADANKQQADAHYKMGISNLQANNPTMAMKELLIAVKNDPENASIHAALAQAYQLKKAYPEAERHYMQALELSDNEPSYQNNLGALYLNMQQWDKAIEYFDKAANNLLFLSPQVALSGEALAYFKKNDLAAAEQHFKEAIAIAPAYAPARYLLSEVYRVQGKEDLEQRALERAVAIAPQYAQAHYQLGVLLMKQQKVEEANKHFKKVIEIAPDTDFGQKANDLLRAQDKS